LQIVVARYQNTPLPALEASISHLRFLFWHMDDLGILPSSRVNIIDTLLRPICFTQAPVPHLYFPFPDNTYSARALLSSPPASNAISAWFIHERYMTQFDNHVTRYGQSWLQFLETVVKVTHHPRLLDPARRGLSQEFEYIINHKADKLVGVLWKFWDKYSGDLSTVRQRLSAAIVPVEGGGRKSLQDTVFPFATLRQSFEDMGVRHFPYLAITDDLREIPPAELSFLPQLKVETAECLSLYLKVLKHLIDTSPRSTATIPAALIPVYERLNNFSGGQTALERLR
jgi:hypothetical protein